jgi:hypothetical protein
VERTLSVAGKELTNQGELVVEPFSSGAELHTGPQASGAATPYRPPPTVPQWNSTSGAHEPPLGHTSLATTRSRFPLHHTGAWTSLA